MKVVSREMKFMKVDFTLHCNGNDWSIYVYFRKMWKCESVYWV